MSPTSTNWRALPLLRHLHEQWWARRGGRIGQAQRPFSCDWEELLQEAGWVTAEQRREAEKDARDLAAAGWVSLKPVKFRPHLISRVSVPLEVEGRLAELFGDPTQQAASEATLKGNVWASELAFIPSIRTGVELEDLLKLNVFLRAGKQPRALVPIKERSVQIFGDEKRLDGLLSSALFGPGRLSLEQLRCFIVGEPLGWKRGPAGSGERPVLILENAATWHSFCRWNKEQALFSAVVYGKGFNIITSVASLKDVFSEIGGARRLLYFGDLDPTGLQIPYRASLQAQKADLPPIEPHSWSYYWLLEQGRGKESPWEEMTPDEPSLGWLGKLAQPVRHLFERRMRLAQELLGWEWLLSQRPDPRTLGE